VDSQNQEVAGWSMDHSRSRGRGIAHGTGAPDKVSDKAKAEAAH